MRRAVLLAQVHRNAAQRIGRELDAGIGGGRVLAHPVDAVDHPLRPMMLRHVERGLLGPVVATTGAAVSRSARVSVVGSTDSAASSLRRSVVRGSKLCSPRIAAPKSWMAGALWPGWRIGAGDSIGSGETTGAERRSR